MTREEAIKYAESKKMMLEALLKYVPSGSVVWCPFDQEKSLFVSELRKHGCEVIHTHIADGQDFFETDIPACDYIISNPPFP